MTLKRWDGASFVDLTTLKRWDGASWVDITLLKRWDGSSWIDVPLPGGGGSTVSVTVTRGTCSGLRINNVLFTTVTSNSTTASASGGTGPYTYSWTKLSGSSAISVSNPTDTTVTFSANVARDMSLDAVYRITATDSLGATGSTTVNVILTHESTA